MKRVTKVNEMTYLSDKPYKILQKAEICRE